MDVIALPAKKAKKQNLAGTKSDECKITDIGTGTKPL
jgi:hypothetical protein